MAATYEDIVAVKDDSTILLIDVRKESELAETGQIPGSINIPLQDVGQALGDTSPEEFQSKYGREKPSFEFPLIFSCLKGGRAQQAANTAQSLGYTNVKVYSGSWTEWAAKNGL